MSLPYTLQEANASGTVTGCSPNPTAPSPQVSEEDWRSERSVGLFFEETSSLVSQLPGEWNPAKVKDWICLGRDDDFTGWDFMGLCIFYVANTSAIPLQGGKKGKQNCMAARARESHGLGRECSQS